MRRLPIVLSLLSLLVAPLASASAREAVARRWAPTFFQETRDGRDLVTAFDFDGDWDGSNNADNVGRFPSRAVIYHTVIETATHWFVTYVVYHPVDGKSPGGHDHDTEHVLLVVRKDGSPTGRLEVMETRFHKAMFQYALPAAHIGDHKDDVDGAIRLDERGRPMVYAQRLGHGLCGGVAPIVPLIEALSLRCSQREVPRIQRRGIVYRYQGRAGVPRSLDDRDVAYDLVEIGDTLWTRAGKPGPHATFATVFDYQGERCRGSAGAGFACPRNIGRLLASAMGHSSTGMPWEEGSGDGMKWRGEHFFDPALTMARRLTFPTPFSTDYVYNPYLGIGGFAPKR